TDDGRPHSAELARADALFENLPIGDANAGNETILRLGHGRIHVKRPGRVLAGEGAEELAYALDRQPARHVARAMPTHAVGDDEETVFGEDEEAVFVVLPLKADIGEAECDGTHGSSELP